METNKKRAFFDKGYTRAVLFEDRHTLNTLASIDWGGLLKRFLGLGDRCVREGSVKAFHKTAKPATRPVTAAVIVAAGASTRMGVPKQFIPLRGVPVIAYTLSAFEQAASIDEIVLVARKEHMLQYYDIVKSYNIGKLTQIVPGGNSRQESAARGIYACHDETAFFAVHDGARPLIRPTIIDAVAAAAYRDGAAAAAVRMKDTIKLSNEEGFITGTPDRRLLWNVQTPQIFERRLYLAALRRAIQEGREYTDDCQLAEAAGYPIRLIEADYGNIKITTPEDVAVAESLLRRQAEPLYGTEG